MALPRFMVLQSKYNHKFLNYMDDGHVSGFLQFSGSEPKSPFTKYEVETAKNAAGLVNIRCCHNKKYWVRSSENHLFIVAGADEPEEDQSNWSCTLFKPEKVDGDPQTFRFRHVQLGHYACLSKTTSPHDDSLLARQSSPDKDLMDACKVIDYDSL